MRDTFNKIFPLLRKHEGDRYVFNKKDPGLHTIKGVTKQTYEKVVGPITLEKFKTLTWEQVKPIYLKHYWIEAGCDHLPVGLDYCLFDMAVHSGPSRAVKHLQKLVKSSPDGIFGKNTLKAVHETIDRWSISMLIIKYMKGRTSFLKRLTHRKTGSHLWSDFPGWATRMKEVADKALDLAVKDNESASTQWEPVSLSNGGKIIQDITNARPEEINLDNLLPQIRRIGRFSEPEAHTVYQHSVFCALIAIEIGMPVAVVQACLEHDLAEAIFGDWKSPIKKYIDKLTGGYIASAEESMLKAIINAKGREYPDQDVWDQVHLIDRTAAVYEWKYRLGMSVQDWNNPEDCEFKVDITADRLKEIDDAVCRYAGTRCETLEEELVYVANKIDGIYFDWGYYEPSEAEKLIRGLEQ